MIKYKNVEVAVISEVICDKCGRMAEPDDMEGQEFLLHRDTAGYASIFGDMNKISIDLCQHCVKELLGPWIQIEQTEW